MNLGITNYQTYSNHLYSAERKLFDEYRKDILKLCKEAQFRNDILKHIGVEVSYVNYKKYVAKLIEERYLSYTDVRHPQSPKQKYVISQKGINYLKAII